MTSTYETPMSLFSHNKCGKITIKHWELNLGAYYLFYILLILWYIRTQRTPCRRACERCFALYLDTSENILSSGLLWCGAGLVIGLERGAGLHMAQLMPLPLTVSCFSKIQIGFTFLVPAHPGSPGQRAVKRCVCVCVCGLLTGGLWDEGASSSSYLQDRTGQDGSIQTVQCSATDDWRPATS